MVYLLQKLLEEDMEMFGEFTKTQVLEWILYEDRSGGKKRKQLFRVYESAWK